MNDEIDYIISKFNFERVHVVMTAIDWRWAAMGNLVPTEVPSVARLKQSARTTLELAFNEKTTIGTGGFYAVYHPPTSDSDEILELRFVLDEVTSESY